MKKIVTITALVLVVLGVGGVIIWKNFAKESVEKIHYHAGFLVYKDNKLVDFSDFKYMHLAPCSEDDDKEKETAEHIQTEKAHLHDNIGDVVHVHRKNPVWGDLFKNLNYEISDNLKAYVNGQEVKEFLDSPINSYESAIIFVGENSDIEGKLKSAVTKEHIVEVEGKSESCGD